MPVGWRAASSLLVANVVGTGVLSLGGAMVALGWMPGLVALVGFAPLNFYCAALLGRAYLLLVAQDHNPGDYFEIARLTLSPIYASLVGLCLYLNLVLTCADYLLVMAKALQAVIFSVRLCAPTSGALSALPLLLLVQCKTMADLSSVSVISAVSITGALIICISQLIRESQHADEAGSGVLYNDTTSIFTKVSATNAMLFASNVQTLFVNILSEMAQPSHFNRTIGGALSLFMTLYLGVAVLSYYAEGGDTPGYLLDALPFTAARTWAGLCMFIHVAISFSISCQVVSRALVQRIQSSGHPRYYRFEDSRDPGDCSEENEKHHTPTDHQNCPRWIVWLVVSLSIVVGAWILANGIPFFFDLVALIGSLTLTPLAFLFPPLIFIGAAQKCGVAVTSWELFALYTLVAFGCVFGIVGFVGTIIDITADWSALEAPPFSCQCEAERCAS